MHHPASRAPRLSLLIALSTAVFPACSGDVSGESSGTTTTDTSPGGGGSGGTTSAGGTGGMITGGTGGIATGGTGGTTMTTTSTTTTTTTTTSMVDPWAGPLESLKLLDVGDVTFGAQKAFPIPDKTLGFTLQVEGAGASDVVGVYRLRPPVGGSVIFNFAMVNHPTQVFGGIQYIGAADPQSDSADAWPVKTGDWKVTLGSDGNSGTSAHVRAWVRRTNDGLFHGGVLDVNLFVVPGAATQSYLDQVINKFFPYVGLQKGTVTAYSTANAYSTIDSQMEYQAMLKTTNQIPNAPAINLFVVDDFADAAYGGAIGVAGGIPGSPMRHGTSQSGLAYQPTGDTTYDATILMHEIGHVGGLFHTTEFGVDDTDPLSDTPECAHATITSNPDACTDKTNVMFPIAYGATAFTNAQQIVLHGSALYRGILDEGGSPAPPLSFVNPGGGPASAAIDDTLASDLRALPTSPDPLERALGSLWCGGGLERAALTVARSASVQLSRVTAPTASARLRAVAFDTTSPILLRKRALRLYFKASREEGKELAAIETLLSILDAGPVTSVADRRFRTAALRLLREAEPTAPALSRKRIAAALTAARASSDTLIASVAAGL